MRARQVTVRGKQVWVVPLGKREVGKRVHIFADTKERAIARAIEKRDELREHGHSLADISASHRGLIIEWRDKLTIEQMGEAFRRFIELRCDSPAVENAKEKYLAAHEDSFSGHHYSDSLYRLKKFEHAFAGRHLDSIIPGELESFVSAQGPSARNFFKVLHTFFAYARRQRWITVDPMTEVPRPSSGATDEKTIFKPAQMKMLLRAASGKIEGCERHESFIALLVLGGLCGLRYSEALRLRWNQVDLEACEIHLDKLKTSKRGLRGRFVKILPSALAWLASLTSDEAGRVVRLNDKNARVHRSRILRAAKLKEWPHNALRRSFGSYHLAAFENADLTAAQMGHTSAETTFAKYRTLARKAHGEAWFGLTPAAVEAPDPDEKKGNVIPFAA